MSGLGTTVNHSELYVKLGWDHEKFDFFNRLRLLGNLVRRIFGVRDGSKAHRYTQPILTTARGSSRLSLHKVDKAKFVYLVSSTKILKRPETRTYWHTHPITQMHEVSTVPFDSLE